jgi:hypothetical protein
VFTAHFLPVCGRRSIVDFRFESDKRDKNIARQRALEYDSRVPDKLNEMDDFMVRFDHPKSHLPVIWSQENRPRGFFADQFEVEWLSRSF